MLDDLARAIGGMGLGSEGMDAATFANLPGEDRIEQMLDSDADLLKAAEEAAAEGDAAEGDAPVTEAAEDATQAEGNGDEVVVQAISLSTARKHAAELLAFMCTNSHTFSAAKQLQMNSMCSDLDRMTVARVCNKRQATIDAFFGPVPVATGSALPMDAES